MIRTPSAPPDEPSQLGLPVDVNRGEPSLTPRLGAALLFVLPLGLLTALMAVTGHFALSVPFGFVCSLVAGSALLVLFQSFEHHDAAAAAQEQGRATGLRCLGELSAAGTLFLVALALGVRGSLPWPHLLPALLVPGSFLLLVVACFRAAQAVGAIESDTPLTRRPGFWLMLFQALIYLPLLGSYSLIDPWETHYGEVAREMLARDDWISLWWAQDGFFWSKPVLDFWLQGLGFSLLGVRYWPDQMLAGVEQGLCPHPEWAVRLPVFLMTALASYILYKALSRTLGARAVGSPGTELEFAL